MEALALDLRAAARAAMPAVTQLPHLAESARRTWLGRMVNEYSSSRVFEGLATQMQKAGFDPSEVDQVRGFATEERRHGVLCGSVVEALGGEARAEWRDEHAFPEHADVSPLEGVLRNLLSISCMSETVAVALIGAERLEMPEGELHELLTGIWSDEVGHARFGWRIMHREVPELDAAAKRRLEAYLRVAFRHVEEHELAHLPVASQPPPEGVVLGLCSGSDARVLFYETIDEVIIPQLEALGLHARAAWDSR
jgi:hypothetical protein